MSYLLLFIPIFSRLPRRLFFAQGCAYAAEHMDVRERRVSESQYLYFMSQPTDVLIAYEVSDPLSLQLIENHSHVSVLLRTTSVDYL